MVLLNRGAFLAGMTKGQAYCLGYSPTLLGDISDIHGRSLRPIYADSADACKLMDGQLKLTFGNQYAISNSVRKYLPMVQRYIPLLTSDYDSDYIASGLNMGSLVPIIVSSNFVLPHGDLPAVVGYPIMANRPLDLSFTEQFMNITISDIIISRANRLTNYANPDYDYRTSYYGMGSYLIDNKWYTVYVEGTEFIDISYAYSRGTKPFLYSPVLYTYYAIEGRHKYLDSRHGGSVVEDGF